jgi:GDP-L-fucose synthase
MAVSTRNPDQTNVVVWAQRLGDAQRSHPGAPGNAMPTLFEGVGDSHAPHHASARRIIVVMTGFWSDRRVVVTGGAGFLGRVVVAKLGALGAQVTVPRSVDFDLTQPGVAERLLEATEPSHIIHLAARVGGIGYNQVAPAPLYLDNLMMGTNVIEAARMAPSVEKTVLLGTVCSYPKFTPVPFREESLWDGYPEETNAPYGIAKKAQLIHAQVNNQQYGQRFAYLIPTNLYGPGDKFHPSVSHVIPARIKRCIEAVEQGEQKLDVWGTGTASREYLYVDDAAEAIVIAAEQYDGIEPVNLGTNREITIRETVEMIATMVGYDGELAWDPTKPDGQPRRRVDPGRAEALFGWRAQMPFEQGLRNTIDWYLANRAEAEREP